jgi:hypothetical protein
MVECQHASCCSASSGASTGDGDNTLGIGAAAGGAGGGDASNAGHSKNPPATHISYDFALCMSMAGDTHPPPIYLCTECADNVRKSCASDHPPVEDHVLPMQQVSLTCENVVRSELASVEIQILKITRD